jgi:hypothetical protein
MTTTAILIPWAAICASYIRFRSAVRVQRIGKVISEESKSVLQPYLAWYGLIWCTVLRTPSYISLTKSSSKDTRSLPVGTIIGTDPVFLGDSSWRRILFLLDLYWVLLLRMPFGEDVCFGLWRCRTLTLRMGDLLFDLDRKLTGRCGKSLPIGF